MLRRTLQVATLAALVVCTPVAAQEVNWSSKRPDGEAPAGVTGARTLDQGEVEIGYRYRQLNSRGLWFQADSLPLSFSLSFYRQVPTERKDFTHIVTLEYGATDDLTFLGTFSYTYRERQQVDNNLLLWVTGNGDVGDAEVSALYKFFDKGGYRAHLQAGVMLPLGSEGAVDNAPGRPSEALPYDMRVGAGVFGIKPGITASAQNERGTVGAQFQGIFYLGTNSLSFRPGNILRGNAWASVRVNDYFAVSGGARYQKWARIQGADPALDTLEDPVNDGFFLDGERFDLSVGLNFYLPEGRFHGQRLSIEAIGPVSHDYGGPQLGLAWGLVLGWQVSF